MRSLACDKDMIECAILTCVFNQIHNQVNRRTKPNILSSPIQQKSIDGTTARRHALRIKSWNLSILVRGKTVNGMRTPLAIQLGENLRQIQRSVVLIKETTVKIGSEFEGIHWIHWALIWMSFSKQSEKHILLTTEDFRLGAAKWCNSGSVLIISENRFDLLIPQWNNMRLNNTENALDLPEILTCWLSNGVKIPLTGWLLNLTWKRSRWHRRK